MCDEHAAIDQNRALLVAVVENDADDGEPNRSGRRRNLDHLAQREPIALDRYSPILHLVQLIRDEAHRFAVTFHRQRRTMRDLRSELDLVPRVGPRRRRTLLTAFGSLAGVRRATREELAAVVGPSVADAVLAHFARQ